MIYFINDCEKFDCQVKYTADVLLKNMGANYTYVSLDKVKNVSFTGSDILIYYITKNNLKNIVCNKKSIVIINSEKLFGINYLYKKSLEINIKKCPIPKLLNMKQNELISLYNNSNTEPYIKTDNDCTIINMDIISDSFFMLTCYEDYINENDSNYKDKHNRIEGKLSLKYDIIDRPIVNEYIELMRNVIKIYDKNYKFNNFCVDHYNKKFIANLTHDVDVPIKYPNLKAFLKITAVNILNKKYKNISKCRAEYINTIKNYKNDVYWLFDEIMKMESKYNFNSSFYFMGSNKSGYDNGYDINDVRVKKLIRELDAKNFECGYHAGYYSYNDYEKMKNEISKVNEALSVYNYGTRQHYLRFSVPETWEIQEQNNLIYDTTVGYPDVTGFKAGFCYPYKPYDLKSNRVLNVWELPLICMDNTFTQYMNLTFDDAIEKVKMYIKIIAEYNGVFTFLIHNTTFNNIKEYDWCKFYDLVLKEINDNNGIGTNGRDIVDAYNMFYNI